jgi:Secretion system C-terminal sorting domain
MTTRIVMLIFLLIQFVFECESQYYETGFKSPTNTMGLNTWMFPENVYNWDSNYSHISNYYGGLILFLDLSFDSGFNFTTEQITHLDTMITEVICGSSYDDWGYHWTPNTLTNKNFVLRINGLTLSYQQCYREFNFDIPDSSKIRGLKVKIVGYGYYNGAYHYLYVDLLQVNVYYTYISSIDENNPNPPKIILYPNPATDKTTILNKRNLREKEIGLDIFSNLGKNVLHKVLHDNENEIDLRNIYPGIYSVLIGSNESKTITKLIKVGN